MKKKLKIDLRTSYPPIPLVLSNKPIVGYRGWGLTPGCKLESVSVNYVWEHPILRNNKKPIIYDGRQRFQLDRNLFGFYAFKEPNFKLYYVPVLGKVSLFGTVIEHADGYRGQNVRVDHLFLLRIDDETELKRQVDSLSKTYDCEVMVRDKGKEGLNKVIAYYKYMEGESSASP